MGEERGLGPASQIGGVRWTIDKGTPKPPLHLLGGELEQLAPYAVWRNSGDEPTLGVRLWVRLVGLWFEVSNVVFRPGVSQPCVFGPRVRCSSVSTAGVSYSAWFAAACGSGSSAGHGETGEHTERAQRPPPRLL